MHMKDCLGDIENCIRRHILCSIVFLFIFFLTPCTYSLNLGLATSRLILSFNLLFLPLSLCMLSLELMEKEQSELSYGYCNRTDQFIRAQVRKQSLK